MMCEKSAADSAGRGSAQTLHCTVQPCATMITHHRQACTSSLFTTENVRPLRLDPFGEVFLFFHTIHFRQQNTELVLQSERLLFFNVEHE